MRLENRKLNYHRIQIQNTCGIPSDPLGNNDLLIFIEVLLYCVCVCVCILAGCPCCRTARMRL